VTRFRLSVRAALSATVWAGATLAAQRPSRAVVAARLDSLARAVQHTRPIASLAVAVMRGDDTLLATGYGFADLENEVPATARTVYRLGSLTKQFTAVAIMQLFEQGKVALDSPMTVYLPAFPTQGHRVTVRHLLTHTSGIKSYTSLGPEWQDKVRLDLTHEQLLALIRDKPFDFSPGDRFLYDNSGYYLLGMIIEQVSGQTYGDYLRDHVFRPLGLSSTSYCDERPLIKRRARGYVRADSAGGFANADPLSMTQPYAAGSLCSDVLDLLVWERALQTNRLISAASYAQMITPGKLNNGTTTGYGFGLGLSQLDGHRRVSHSGGINGFQTELDYYPDDSLTVVALINTEGSNPGRIAERLARTAMGIPDPIVKDLPLTDAERARYAGTYTLGPLQLRVFTSGGQLMAQATGQGAFALRYQGENTFIASFDENVRLVFELAPGAAAATAFTLYQGGIAQRATRVAAP